MRRLVTPAHVAATLRVAARLIELGGWYRGTYAPGGKHAYTAQDTCPVCLMGAVAQAAGLNPDAWEDDPQDTDAAFAHRVMREAVRAVGVHLDLIDPADLRDDEGFLAERVGNQWNDRQSDPDVVLRALLDTAEEVDRRGLAAA